MTPSRSGSRVPPASAPYGTWSSPLTPEAVAAGSLRLSAVACDGDDIYWTEGRPDDQGRTAIVRRTPDGRVADVTPPGTNVRSRVNEYGGAAYLVSRGTVYYSEFADQRLYRLRRASAPEPLTPPGQWFYADCALDPLRQRLVCVREDHGIAGHEPVTTLVSVALDGSPTPGDVIASGHDFYSTPRFSPDGTQLAWLAWRHPQMPWDGTELWIADVGPDGGILRPRSIAGGSAESIFQPGWSPDGTLYFVSDRSGWWNLYRLAGSEVQPVYPMAAEFGRPQWQFGTCTWAFAGDSRLVVAFGVKGRWTLGTLDLRSGVLTPTATGIEPAESLTATATHAVIVGGSPRRPDAVMRVELGTGQVDTIRSASDVNLDDAFLSAAETIEFPTDEGHIAHAFYYAPRNGGFTGSPAEAPPLIVITHGGPTASTHARLNLEVQYWTSRGFAVADVNYGGSTGYGRQYRDRLKGRWGIVDVADCVNAAAHLAAQGKADPSRLIIRGRSAGGYTTLAALTFRPDAFGAGASYYGIGDLELLVRDTHKFESRYLDGLVGPYPEAQEVYRARSPIHHVDRLGSPLLLFQGLQDPVVPPNQAETMAAAVRAKGLPVSLVTFEGEQHGFRKAATIVRCLEIELFFYGSVFGFTPAGAPPTFEIANR